MEVILQILAYLVVTAVILLIIRERIRRRRELMDRLEQLESTVEHLKKKKAED
jgi:hypothetical protein